MATLRNGNQKQAEQDEFGWKPKKPGHSRTDTQVNWVSSGHLPASFSVIKVFYGVGRITETPRRDGFEQGQEAAKFPNFISSYPIPPEKRMRSSQPLGK